MLNDVTHSANSKHMYQGRTEGCIDHVCLDTKVKQFSDNLSMNVNVPDTCSTVSNTSSEDTTGMINKFVSKHYGIQRIYDECETSTIDSDDLFKSGSIPFNDVDTKSNRNTHIVSGKPLPVNNQNVDTRRYESISDESCTDEASEHFRKAYTNNDKSSAYVFIQKSNREPGLSKNYRRRSNWKRTNNSDVSNNMQMDVQCRRFDPASNEQRDMDNGGFDLCIRFSSDHCIGSDLKPIIEAGRPVKLRGNISSDLAELSTGTNTRLKGVISINMSADLTADPIDLK